MLSMGNTDAGQHFISLAKVPNDQLARYQPKFDIIHLNIICPTACVFSETSRLHSYVIIAIQSSHYPKQIKGEVGGLSHELGTGQPPPPQDIVCTFIYVTG